MIAIVGRAAGIVAGWLVYQLKRVKAVEPEILENAWYYDQAVSEFMGGPAGRRSRPRRGSTPTSSTARSTAPAERVRGTAGVLRKAQSGYVRVYAGIIGVGVVLLLAWFVVVRGIL